MMKTQSPHQGTCITRTPTVTGRAQEEHDTQWEAPLGGTYIGEGEWVQAEEPMDETPLEGKEGTLESEPLWIYKWRCKVDRDIRLHQEVLDKGYPNRWGAQILIQSKWNLDRFKQLLGDYGDREVVEWMRYGWPIGRLPTLTDPDRTGHNHKGALEFPEALKKYIAKESSKGAIR